MTKFNNHHFISFTILLVFIIYSVALTLFIINQKTLSGTNLLDIKSAKIADQCSNSTQDLTTELVSICKNQKNCTYLASPINNSCASRLEIKWICGHKQLISPIYYLKPTISTTKAPIDISCHQIHF